MKGLRVLLLPGARFVHPSDPVHLLNASTLPQRVTLRRARRRGSRGVFVPAGASGEAGPVRVQNLSEYLYRISARPSRCPGAKPLPAIIAR